MSARAYSMYIYICVYGWRGGGGGRALDFAGSGARASPSVVARLGPVHMYMYMYIYMYVYICIYVYMYTHTDTHIQTHARACIYTYIHTDSVYRSFVCQFERVSIESR